MLNLRIRFVDGREDLITPCPINYGNYWCMFKHLSKLLRDNCIYEDEIIDASVTPSGSPFEAGMVRLKTDSHKNRRT